MKRKRKITLKIEMMRIIEFRYRNNDKYEPLRYKLEPVLIFDIESKKSPDFSCLISLDEQNK